MIFEVQHGNFAYPNGRHVLKDISFSVGTGEMLAILGPNGAGKTTLLRCMMGFLKWNTGKSMLDGENIANIANKIPNITDDITLKPVIFLIFPLSLFP